MKKMLHLCLLLMVLRTFGQTPTGISPSKPGVITKEFVTDIPMNYPFCGRLSAIAINPWNGQHIVVAGESGGLFETKNAGGTGRKWKHINEFKEAVINDVLLVAVPGGFDLYAATASAFNERSAPLIWKRSIDGRWQRIVISPIIGSEKANTYRIIEKSQGSKILYACGDYGLAYSDISGVWKIKSGPSGNPIFSIEVMKDGSILAGNSNGIYRLTDISSSWTLVTTTAKIPASDKRFALKADAAKSIVMVSFSDGTSQRIYSSVDLGVTWQPFRNSHTAEPGIAGGYVSVYPDYDLYNKKLTVYTSNRLELKYAIATGATAIDALSNMQTSPTLIWNADINTGHTDTRQIAFLRQGVSPSKMIVTSDGGFHIADIKSDGIVKNYNWNTENTNSGLKAVQIYNLTGHDGSFYFGTQDNGFGASTNDGRSFTCGIGGEGMVIPMYGTGTNTTGQTIVLPSVDVYTDKKIFGIGTLNGIPWNMPSSGWGSPIFLSANTYIQDARPAEGSAILPWKISYDNGRRWTDIAPANYVRYGNLRHGFGLSERGITAGGDKYSLYITMNGPSGKKVLGRLNNVAGTPNNWTYPSLNGLDGGVGIIGTQFMWDATFAVDPYNANNLLAVEQQTGKLKISNDGGNRWNELNSFTSVYVTSISNRFKSISSGLNNNAITSISFCPYDAKKILVGTFQQGVFYSKDGGGSWKKLNDPGVFMVTSFYWSSASKVFMSTYGRGIFRIDL